MIRNKYNAKKVKLDGYTFDSMMEADHYCELKLLERAKVIRDLKVHPAYILQEPFIYQGRKERAIKYEADFSYEEDGRQVVEDVKGMRTDAYKIKRKLFLYKYNDVIFKEVHR